MIAPTTDMAESKLCSKCCTMKPISTFSLIRKSSPVLQPWCRECKKRAARDLYARQRYKRDGNTIAELNRELKRAANPEQVEFLLGDAMGQLGGLENFRAAWAEQNKAELKRNLGGRRSSDIFAGITNAYAVCHKAHSINLAGLDSEGVAEKLARYLLRLHQRFPEEAKRGMVNAGWPEA